MSGYDMELIQDVNRQIRVPLIVCGGAGKLSDFIDCVKATGVSAVSAASIFHFTDQNLIKTRFHMRNAGLNVRSLG
jgi:cyclase